MNDRPEHATVGEIVATDFRTAGVFETFGIDFCCGGRRSLADACRTAAADPAAVIRALNALPPPATVDDDVTRWPLERLIDHILVTHHAYVRSALPAIARYLEKLHEIHGARHPELTRIATIFEQVIGDLEQHMFKEEQILFPYVRDLARQFLQAGQPSGAGVSPFGTVENPIRMMEREHREAADELRLIRELTNGYTPPADGCTTYTVCMAELAQFERDLHRHVHLENNVLFPKAVELEIASSFRT
ncbi:MAG: iron-sulfur cluster repair di-iron protein [Acidobacteria bacterium]|nr:iron-sulfur cluster repair di-iron protein [Acidobacteriota bacterium]